MSLKSFFFETQSVVTSGLFAYHIKTKTKTELIFHKKHVLIFVTVVQKMCLNYIIDKKLQFCGPFVFGKVLLEHRNGFAHKERAKYLGFRNAFGKNLDKQFS